MFLKSCVYLKGKVTEGGWEGGREREKKREKELLYIERERERELLYIGLLPRFLD